MSEEGTFERNDPALPEGGEIRNGADRRQEKAGSMPPDGV